VINIKQNKGETKLFGEEIEFYFSDIADPMGEFKDK